MRILITNDDGINSHGIHMLIKEMEKDNEVIVAAPSGQRSACGHSITINRQIAVREVKLEGIKSRTFAVDGTPADCTKIAMEKLVDGRIDYVISGVNYGLNIGTDVIYSGTVSAAIESAIYKIPSIAVSMDIRNGNDGYEIAAGYAKDVLNKAIKNPIGDDLVLNINVPYFGDRKIQGIKVCSLGNRVYTDCYIQTMEKDEMAFQLKGEAKDEEEENTDVFYINRGYVTVTPLHYDLTNFKILNEVKNWL